jgi:hypothetical protein
MQGIHISGFQPAGIAMLAAPNISMLLGMDAAMMQ